jgi:ElaB/YqjD/DUF883 family membrane-anchored ribosome-binding protein
MANSATTDPKNTSNQKADESGSKADLKEVPSNAGEAISSTFESVRGQSAEALSKAREASDFAVREGQEMVSSAHQQFAEVVKRNPTAMVLSTLGVGVLIGLAMRRQS